MIHHRIAAEPLIRPQFLGAECASLGAERERLGDIHTKRVRLGLSCGVVGRGVAWLFARGKGLE